MDATTAALLGAAVGAGASLVGNALQTWAQDRRAREERREARAARLFDLRRQAYGAFADEVHRLIPILDDDEDEAYHRAWGPAWEPLQVRAGAVALYGTQAASAAADQLVTHLVKYHFEGDDEQRQVLLAAFQTQARADLAE